MRTARLCAYRQQAVGRVTTEKIGTVLVAIYSMLSRDCQGLPAIFGGVYKTMPQAVVFSGILHKQK